MFMPEIQNRNQPAARRQHPVDAKFIRKLGAANTRAAYGAALKLNADFLPAHLNLARLAAAEGNLAEARQTYAAMLKKNRNDAVAMYESGVLEQRAGNAAEATRWAPAALATGASAACDAAATLGL